MTPAATGPPVEDGRTVLLGTATRRERDDLAALAARAHRVAGEVPGALALAAEVGDRLPAPGTGRTAYLWSALASAAAADLTVARVLEPHLDALAILGQAGVAPRVGTWGVFAAEGPGPPVQAEVSGATATLTGRKHWCSLASSLDRALVTARVGDARRLFAVDLRHPGVSAVEGTWVARGLAGVDSGPVDLDHVPATPVGEPGWYLTRPGFSWGGLGVAAVWYGGTVGLARRLLEGARRRTPDHIALMHLGAVDGALHAARSVLAEAAAETDAGTLHGDRGALAAYRVRALVAGVAEEVLDRVAHGLGPGPLATEEQHARRVADLGLYLRQWHAERDQAALGRLLLTVHDRGW